MTHDQRLAVKSVVSGVLSYALVGPLNNLFHANDLGQVLPGLLFGAFVAGAETPAGPRRYTRWSLMIISSTALYSLAVKLAVHLIAERHWRDFPACTLAGFLGAIAMGLLVRFIVPRDITPRQLTQAAVVGAVAGSLFGLKGTFGIPSNLEVCTMVAGFVCWQTGVAWTLLRSKNGA